MRAGEPALERFRAFVKGRLGLAFDDCRQDVLAEALERRATEGGARVRVDPSH